MNGYLAKHSCSITGIVWLISDIWYDKPHSNNPCTKAQNLHQKHFWNYIPGTKLETCMIPEFMEQSMVAKISDILKKVKCYWNKSKLFNKFQNLQKHLWTTMCFSWNFKEYSSVPETCIWLPKKQTASAFLHHLLENPDSWIMNLICEKDVKFLKKPFGFLNKSLNFLGFWKYFRVPDLMRKEVICFWNFWKTAFMIQFQSYWIHWWLLISFLNSSNGLTSQREMLILE